MTKPPIRYLGGKTKHLKWLLSHFPFPDSNTQTFIDCCGGSGAVCLNSPNYNRIIYNDIYKDLFNFFSILRDPETRDELIYQIALTPKARDEWLLGLTRNDTSQIERVRRFYTRCNQAFLGLEYAGAWMTSRTPENNKSKTELINKVMNLHHIHDLLTKIIIENRDIFYIIDFYDSSSVFFYIDPPYPDAMRQQGQGCNQYAHDDASSWDWHKRLADRLKSIKGKAIVSSYASDEYAAMFDGFRRVDGEPYLTGVDAGKTKRQEMILLNFEDHEQSQPKLI